MELGWPAWLAFALKGFQLSAGAPRACLNMELHGEDVPSGSLHAKVACDTGIGVG